MNISTQPRTLKTKIVPGSMMDRRRGWFVFRAFGIYRVVLAGILLGVFFLDEHERYLGTEKPALFLWTTLGYMVAVLVSIGGSFRRRPQLAWQVYGQTLVDLAALSLLIHASGGSSSSLTILLVTAVATSGILLPLGPALITAATASLFITVEWLFRAWSDFPGASGLLSVDRIVEFLVHVQPHSDELIRLGILSASFFIAVLLTFTLAERTRRTEELVRQRTQELLEIAELNQTIVQHLQSGVVVVDRFAQVRVMNDMARELLNHGGPVEGVPLSDISPVLSQRLATWLSSGLNNPKPFRQAEHLPDVTPSFTHLGGNKSFDTLIFLEDSAQATQRLQQIKLAALGRLTAGIAHEIRNPLASISHASQLLEESPSTSPGDRRLAQIIHDNANRANRIITNVLDMSRRDKARPEDLELLPWLEEFRREFGRAEAQRAPEIELEVNPEPLSVRFDPGHLHQIVWNLCSNACLHGGASQRQSPRIRLVAGIEEARARPYLDVIDYGEGIPQAEAKRIFEPFFTTRPQGTGLGLYISREMCEANRAQIQYLRPGSGGSCFRITFAAPSKQDSQWTLAMP